MNRREITEMIVVRAAPEQQQKLRQELANYTLEELELVARAIVSQASANAAEEELLRIQAERAVERWVHQDEMKQRHDQAQRTLLKQTESQDRETFAEACRKYSISNIDANFKLLRDMLGPNLNSYQIGQAVTSGAAQVVPATEQEQQQWRKEAQEERQDFLAHEATPLQLREIVNAEAESRRNQFQREQTERQISERAKSDAHQGYAALPEFNFQGVKIDAVFLKNLAPAIYRNYLRKFGATQITLRLNGIQ